MTKSEFRPSLNKNNKDKVIRSYRGKRELGFRYNGIHILKHDLVCKVN